jgi:hypothetical protein
LAKGKTGLTLGKRHFDFAGKAGLASGARERKIALVGVPFWVSQPKAPVLPRIFGSDGTRRERAVP